MKPELDKPKYWLHLVIVAVVTLGILQLLFGGNMLSINKVLLSVPILAVADTFAHTALKLD